MKRIIFEVVAFEQFNEWASGDRKFFNKLLKLVKETAQTPYTGAGKPEPLKYEFHGYWSRRITDEHRLVYKVTEKDIIIASCKYHY